LRVRKGPDWYVTLDLIYTGEARPSRGFVARFKIEEKAYFYLRTVTFFYWTDAVKRLKKANLSKEWGAKLLA